MLKQTGILYRDAAFATINDVAIDGCGTIYVVYGGLIFVFDTWNINDG